MAMAEQFDLSNFQPDREVLKNIPVELMFRYNFVPLAETDDGELAIAVADPDQILMIDEISFLLNRRIITKASPLEQIVDVLKRTEPGK
jgi:type IV pilus assembly protein PilB